MLVNIDVIKFSAIIRICLHELDIHVDFQTYLSKCEGRVQQVTLGFMFTATVISVFNKDSECNTNILLPC